MDIFFRCGLPRSGSTLLTSILEQNDYFFCDTSTALVTALSSARRSFALNTISSEYEMKELAPRRDALAGLLYGYFKGCNKSAVISNDHNWTRVSIPLLESLIQKKIKMIVSVRASHEIIASFEKMRIENPLECNFDEIDNGCSTISSRADFFNRFQGVLGSNYNHLYDNVVQGYSDRLLFIDYNKLCEDPGKQMRRIYNFLDLPFFKHDFKNIPQSKFIFQNNHAGGHFNSQHDLRPVIESNKYAYEKYIGKHTIQHQKQYFPSFWEQYT
jgi:sulfotransferase